ncbi:MAG: aminotransferase class V-fold PLP-dependent enzyme [Gammaproteobacteria bacterium]|nr:aminotransferase class V-fold PLP-dependent enzyme [Gammaproteobacteria bacterium]
MDSSLWNAPRGYLNTALRGIPPKASIEAAKRTLDLWSRGELEWVAWLDELENVRREFAALLGVSPAQVGIGHTTAALVNVVAANLKSGSRVLVPEFEHNSNTIPFVAQRYRGISVDTAPLQDIARRVSGDYAAVALSLVQSFDGSIVDLAAVSQACRRAGALLCVDVTQAAGWLPFDAALADVIVCSSYKWLMGPNGPAFIVLRADLVDSFRQLQPNWFACEEPHAAPYGIDFPAARSARKFDVVPGLISASALLPSLALINELGVSNIHRHNTQLAATLCRRLNVEHNGSAILMLDAPGASARLKARGIRVSIRGERIRVAIHVYNTAEDLEALADAIR